MMLEAEVLANLVLALTYSYLNRCLVNGNPVRLIMQGVTGPCL